MSPIGRTLAALSGLMVIVACWLPWINVGSSAEATPLDISSGWALGADVARLTSAWTESMLLPLMLGAVLILIGAAVGSSAVTAVGGFGVLLMVGLWDLQENRLISGGSVSWTGASDVTLDGSLGPGPVVAVVGALLALVCAFLLRDRTPDVVMMSS